MQDEVEEQAQRGTIGGHETLCDLLGDAPRMPRTRTSTNTTTTMPLSVEEGGGCSGLQQLPVTPTQSPHVSSAPHKFAPLVVSATVSPVLTWASGWKRRRTRGWRVRRRRARRWTRWP